MLDLHGRKDHVLHDRLMREEIEVLEHHAHLLTMQVQIHLVVGDIHAFEQDRSARGCLQQIQTAEKGGFARAGGADDNHDVTTVDIHGHTVQRLDLAFFIILFQVLDLDQLIVCRHGSSSFQNAQ